MKRIILYIVATVLLLSVTLNALAVTTIGPNAYSTLSSATKTTARSDPRITLTNVTVEDADLYYTLWVRRNEDDSKTRVTLQYEIYDGDNGFLSDVVYLWDYYGSYIVVGDSYAVRVHSHPDTGTGVINTIEVSSFIP